MFIINKYMKGALTKMVKAFAPRQKIIKSILVTEKFNSNSNRKATIKFDTLQGRSLLCTTKFFQNEGMDGYEDEEEQEDDEEDDKSNEEAK